MNTFYGKSVNQMNFNELTLLSIDIQLSSFEQVKNIPTHITQHSYRIREALQLKCINDGGDYSRERFLNDLNGTRPNEIEGMYDDFIEIPNVLSLN